ncbi:MAG: hypothetical protein ACHQX3_00285 [Nitrospirales bacterium]
MPPKKRLPPLPSPLPKLYHFTSLTHLPEILAAGAITRGDVPLTPTGGFNTPWLTSDSERVDQYWSVFAAKQVVRFTIHIPKADRKSLVKWSDFALAMHIDPEWYAALDKVAGHRSDAWYLYLDKIPLRWVTDTNIASPLPNRSPPDATP